jgi:acetolactate synthase-1/2/3 large subunit
MPSSVADSLCAALGERGVTHMFGVPGTETIDLWEAVRRTGLRAIVPTSELTAAFMAVGYAAASGRAGVLTTIGGPGFTFALSGVVEARLDSVPLVYLVTPPHRASDGPSGALPQAELARSAAKALFQPTEPEETTAAVCEALAAATSGEPGPVIVEVRPEVLRGPGRRAPAPPPDTPVAAPEVAAVVEALRRAERPLLFCGSGVADAAAELVRLAEGLPTPVVTTTSGRGVIPETHRLSLANDAPGGGVEPLNELIAQCDLVLALGCKLTSGGTRGHALQIPRERLVRVDASAEVMGNRYPARLEIVGDVPAVVREVARELEREASPTSWTAEEIERWRRRLEEESRLMIPEPRLGGVDAGQFFAALRSVVPADVTVATDSGLHQYLVRSYLPVLAPRTLLVPADFQSMGYGIPAAVGAALATGRSALAVVGDGGFNIVGSELLTAVREGLSLVVVVVVDRHLGLIRVNQALRTGRPTGVNVPVADLELVARSVGADYLALGDGDPAPLAEALGRGGVTLVELPARDTPALGRARVRGLALAGSRTVLGPGAASRVVAVVRRLTRR